MTNQIHVGGCGSTLCQLLVLTSKAPKLAQSSPYGGGREREREREGEGDMFD